MLYFVVAKFTILSHFIAECETIPAALVFARCSAIHVGPVLYMRTQKTV